MIAILNYGMGNLRSVQKAFERVGAQAEIVDRAEDAARADRLLLPGVGAFADGMANLRDSGLVEPIHDFAKTGKPLMGICLGMQLLFESSMEDAVSPDQPVAGLGLCRGKCCVFARIRAQVGPG